MGQLQSPTPPIDRPADSAGRVPPVRPSPRWLVAIQGCFSDRRTPPYQEAEGRAPRRHSSRGGVGWKGLVFPLDTATILDTKKIDEMATPSPAPTSTPPTKPLRAMDYLGIFFGITTVLSLAMAYHWHAQSMQERTPTYYVSPERTRIVDTSIPAPSDLQVLYKGKDLNADVSAVTVYLWNDGKLPIKAEDVLDPVNVHLNPTCTILDTRLLKVSRPVTKFVKGEATGPAKNVLPVSFAILESGDGAAIQIIYTGDPGTEITIGGTIVGAGEPQPTSTPSFQSQAQTRGENARHLRLNGYLICLTALGYIGLAVFAFLRWRKEPAHRRARRRLTLAGFSACVGAAALVAGIYSIHNADRLLSPVPASIWTQN